MDSKKKFKEDICYILEKQAQESLSPEILDLVSEPLSDYFFQEYN